MSEKVKKQFDVNTEAQLFIGARSQQYAPPISRRLIAAVRRQMIKGVRDGERLGDIVGRARKILSDQAPFRVLKIVRTEVVGAFNAGTLEGYRQAPAVVKQKEWLTARDGNVRPTQPGDFNHQASDTQRRNVDDPFQVSGELLMHPGDPGGSPGNIINCRCTMLPVTERQLGPAPRDPVSDVPPAATAGTRPRRRTRPRSTKPPRRLTDAEATAFFATVDEPTARKWLEQAATNEEFRNLVMTDKILAGTKGFDLRGLKGDIWGQFDPSTSVVAFDTSLIKQGPFTRTGVATHEIFHGVTQERRWFSRAGALKINLNNPEAARLFELYNNAMGRAERVLAEKAADVTADKAARRASKKWLGKVRQAKSRKSFGLTYRRGFTDWNEMRLARVVDADKMGIPRAYSLHSPHEYATTSFEKFVFSPKQLQSRDPDMFNFFQNFYKEGVFKRAVGILRAIR